MAKIFGIFALVLDLYYSQKIWVRRSEPFVWGKMPEGLLCTVDCGHF